MIRPRVYAFPFSWGRVWCVDAPGYCYRTVFSSWERAIAYANRVAAASREVMP